MKKSLALVLVATLLLSVFSLQTAALPSNIRVKAGDYDSYGQVSQGFADWGVHIRLYSGDWLSYKVNFEDAGIYEIKLRAGAYTDKNMSTHIVTPYLDSVSLGAAKYTPTTTSATGEIWEWHSVGIVKIEEAGEHELKLVFNTANIRLIFFDLVPVEFATENFYAGKTQFVAGDTVAQETDTFTLDFNAEIDPASVDNADISISSKTGDVAIEWEKEGDKLILRLKESLIHETEYTIFVNGIKNIYGQSYSGKISFVTTQTIVSVHAMDDLVEGTVLDSSIITYARLYNGNYLIYDVKFPFAGTYSLKVVAAQGIVQNSFLDFSIEDKTVNSALITKTGTFEKWQDFEAGFVNVKEAGTIRFKLTVPSGNFSLKSFEFTLVEDFLTEAEKCTTSSGCIIKELSERETVVLMEKGDSMSFEASISNAGVYSLSLCASGSKKASLTVICDEEPIIETELTFTEGWSKYSNTEIGLHYLTSGNHIFTLSIDDGELALDKFAFNRDEGIFLVSEQSQNTLTGSIRNFTTEAVNGKIIYALYDSHGKLKDCITEENISVSVADRLELFHTFGNVCDGDTGKIFYWSGDDSLMPLTEAGQTQFSFKKTEPYMQIYVDKAGDDNDEGSFDAPFATIERALEEASDFSNQMDGDIEICINPGTYYIKDTINITNEHNGKNGYRVILKGTDSEDIPVIHGGVRVTGWTEGQNGIWSASFDAVGEVRNLYVNGYAAQRARSSYLYSARAYYTTEESEYANDGVTVSLDGFPQNFEHPEDLEAIWDIEWTSSHVPVNKILYRSETADVVFDQPYYSYIGKESNTMIGTGETFYLENDLTLLDEAGEFYYDKHANKLYYYPFAEENLAVAEIYVPSTEGLVSIKGTLEVPVQNITVQNIDFRYGSWNDVSEYGLRDSQADVVEVNNIGSMMPAQFDVSYAKGIQIESCRLSSMGSAALAMTNAVTDSSVKGCVITDCSATGIILGHWRHTTQMPEGYARCTNLTVSDNVIRRCGLEYKGSCGIAAYYVNHANIIHNDLETLPYTGISLGWGWGTVLVPECRDNTIAFNRISDVMCALKDGGHIYTLGALRNTHIYENLCTASGDYRGGIYTDNGTDYITVRDNVISGSVHNWLYAVASNLGDILVLNNFTDTERMVNTYPNCVDIKGTTLISDLSSNAGAHEISENAGAHNVSAALREAIEYPVWRTQFIKNVPHNTYIVYPEGTIQAEDYTGGSPREFSKTSITLDPGDSVSYNVNLDAGFYKIKTSGFLKQTYPSTIGVYVDGNKVATCSVDYADNWNVKCESSEEVFMNLLSGEHNVTLKMEKGYYIMDYLVLTKN